MHLAHCAEGNYPPRNRSVPAVIGLQVKRSFHPCLGWMVSSLLKQHYCHSCKACVACRFLGGRFARVAIGSVCVSFYLVSYLLERWSALILHLVIAKHWIVPRVVITNHWMGHSRIPVLFTTFSISGMRAVSQKRLIIDVLILYFRKFLGKFLNKYFNYTTL